MDEEDESSTPSLDPSSYALLASGLNVVVVAVFAAGVTTFEEPVPGAWQVDGGDVDEVAS